MDSTRHVLGSDTDSSGFFFIPEEPPEFVLASSRYEITDEIGRGGMGVIFRAKDTGLNREVAVKILLREISEVAPAQHRFSNEAKILGSLQHPGIISVYDCGQTDDCRPFLAMKLVDGQTLAHLLDFNPGEEKPIGTLINVFASVCHAMAYTHSEKIAHLDLKPTNIMVGEFGEVHVMDWGLARLLNSESGTRAHDSIGLNNNDPLLSKQILGTLRYMAPEQARGKTLDKRTDVFALGAILSEILTGQPPYTGRQRSEVLNQARNADLESTFAELDNCRGEPGLVRLAKNCLQEDPDNRPANANEVANVIASYSQSALNQIENDMTRFFELSLDLFCIADFDGYFRRLNSNFSRVLGYSNEELLAKPFLDFVVKEDREKTKEVMGQLLNGQSVVRFRNRYRTSDGELLEFEWTAKSIVDENVIFAVARNMS